MPVRDGRCVTYTYRCLTGTMAPTMQRRDLLKVSPLVLASTVGRSALAQSPSAPGSAEAIFNVRTFGATGDGKTVDSPAINKAIEAVAAAGGGTLVFPAGTYMCFSIHLKSHVDLWLDRGCTILAAALASRRNRCLALPLFSKSAAISFKATGRSRVVSVAL